MQKQASVVTGVGMVTALGMDARQTFENMLRAKSGAAKITRFDTKGMDTQFAAQVDNGFLSAVEAIVKRRDAGKMTRVTKMGMLAAHEAVVDSGIDFEVCDRTRIAVIMGVIAMGYNDMEKAASEDYTVVKSMPNALSAWISLKYGLYGPNFSVSTACASSAYAIHLGRQMIEADQADAVIVGGADSHICREYIAGFNQIMALSVRNDDPVTASRPFDKTRDGFVMGEGAGVLVLESKAHAEKRRARIYASLPGSAITSEAEDITAPQKDGVGMCYTMNEALRSAGMAKEEIGYVNAHGTATYLNDLYETMALKDCFGDHAYQLKVSSSKSMVGHTLGAASAIECIVTALSLQKGILTPTINYKTPDKALDLNYIPNEPIECRVSAAISNSFGFGGHNSCLVLKSVNV